MSEEEVRNLQKEYRLDLRQMVSKLEDAFLSSRSSHIQTVRVDVSVIQEVREQYKSCLLPQEKNDVVKIATPGGFHLTFEPLKTH